MTLYLFKTVYYILVHNCYLAWLGDSGCFLSGPWCRTCELLLKLSDHLEPELSNLT